MTSTMPPAEPYVPDLLYSEVEEALRASVRSVLDRHSAWGDVLARTESASPVDAMLWSRLAQDVGCAGLAVPEELGGAGASWREVAVVAEELGRAVAPVPFLGSAVMATSLVLELGASSLLQELAAGTRTAAVVVPFGTPPGGPLPDVVLREGKLFGLVRDVADARTAEALLVPCRDGLYLVESSAGGALRHEVLSLDMTRPLVDLELGGVEAQLLAGPEAVHGMLERALRAGAVILASEQLGTAERCLETTLDHLKVRHQFGRPLGSFQALKHRVADVWVALTQARAVARYAAAALAEDAEDLPVAAALAQAVCSEVVELAAEECLQLHGGIGFTWEHPAHLYLKRAKSTAIALGTVDRHRSALAALVDLPAPGRL